MADLEVFVSWSRPGSHQTALAFVDWLPLVLPGVKPWLSSEDITKGTPWFASISEQLQKSAACLICITPENVGSPWLFYEAGAIAHAMPGALICPYLIGVDPSQIAGTPLGQYQVTRFDKDDTWRLIRSLNHKLPTPHHGQLLQGNFDANWSSLQRKLVKVSEKTTPPKQTETPDEIAFSPEQRHILIEASRDKSGSVLMLKDTGGFHIQASDKQLCDPRDARVEAAYRDAVNYLLSRQLLRDDSGTGAPPCPVTMNDADALCLLQGWFGTRSNEQRRQTISFDDVDRDLKLPPGTSARLLDTAAHKHHYEVDEKGDKFVIYREMTPEAELPTSSDDMFWSNPSNPYRRRSGR